MEKLEKITNLTDNAIQFWLRTVEEQDVLNGLLGASAEVRQRVTDNMSPRARVMVREYLESHANLDQRIIDASLNRLEESLELVR